MQTVKLSFLVLVVLVLSLATCGTGERIAATTQSPSEAQQPPPTIPGIAPTRHGDLRFVGFHGVQIAVPATWRLEDQRCGAARSDTVLYPDVATEACYWTPPPNLTVVTFFELSTAIRLGWSKAAFHTVADHGQMVSVGWLEAARQRPRLLVLFARQVGAAVAIQSPSEATARRLMASVRVVKVDADGCPSEVGRLHPLGPSAVPGADGELVPGAPTGVALCRYEDFWLAESAHASGHALSTLVAILNSLKPGTSHVRGSGGESASACAQDAHRGFLLRFSYPNGVLEPVLVHISGCGALSAANGSRSGQINWPIVTALTQALGYEAFPDPSELVGVPPRK